MPSMFGSWLNRIPKEYKPLVLLGAAALCWSVSLCRNDVVFDNKKSSFLQVIYSTTHWLRTWAILQKHTLQDKLVAASRFLEQVAKDFFLSGHMGGDLVLELTVINVEGSLSNSFRLCVDYAEVRKISRRCITLMYCA